MKIYSRNLGRLLKARLSISVAAWVFLSIVAIEMIIFVPSYLRREQELITQIQEVSTAKVGAILSLNTGSRTSDQLLTQLESLMNYSTIVGGALYDTNTQLVGTFGEIPQALPVDRELEEMEILPVPKVDRVDMIWVKLRMNKGYTLILRQDTTHIQSELQAFGGRIAGLVFIIALFVTATTMAVLTKLVIWPILRLRDDLEIVGESLNGKVDDQSFYSLSVDRSDELGEVMGAFREMLQRVRAEILSRTESEIALRSEQNKSDQLLLNILPGSIADRLKDNDRSIADGFASVTVLFADLVGFTEISSIASPQELVELLNRIFSIFDQLSQDYGLEKIKTIGDEYMVAGGLPLPQADHAQAIAQMALAMQKSMEKFTFRQQPISLRIGINSGAVVAGVIGIKKFSYDLWGDTVNVASRMESSGSPGKIQVAETTYQLLKDKYEFLERGLVNIKGKGEMMTYWLVGSID